MEKKRFKLGAILSIVGDKLMCEIGDVYEILNYMTGDNLFTHQRSRAAKVCKPIILKKYPLLQAYLTNFEPNVNSDTYQNILNDCELLFGKELDIEMHCAVDNHEFKDPISELTDMMQK